MDICCWKVFPDLLKHFLSKAWQNVLIFDLAEFSLRLIFCPQMLRVQKFITRNLTNSTFAKGRSLPILSWPMRSTGLPLKCKVHCWKRCRKDRLLLESKPFCLM